MDTYFPIECRERDIDGKWSEWIETSCATESRVGAFFACGVANNTQKLRVVRRGSATEWRLPA